MELLGGLSAVAFCAEAALSESGGAGTGKTTAVRAILAALEAVRASLPALQRHVMKPHPKAAWVRFDDGAEDAITTADLEKLTHGRAISVPRLKGRHSSGSSSPSFGRSCWAGPCSTPP